MTRILSWTEAPERLTVWIAMAVGSVSAASRVDQRVRHPKESCFLDASVPAERSVPRREVCWHAFEAHRRPPALTSAAMAATGARVRDHSRSWFPLLVVTCGPDDGARPLVSEDVTGSCEAFEHEMQIGAAYAAVRDLDEDLVRSRLGNGKLLHLHPAFAHVYRSGHGCRDRAHRS